jgi:hypothetical protein
VEAEIHPEIHRASGPASQRRRMPTRAPCTQPAPICADGGRAIDNFEPERPQTLTGFAKKAHELYEKELAPLGYKVRAQIMDYPGGMPGDVGIFLRW